MNVNKVGDIGPIYNPKRANKINELSPGNLKQDTIEISEEARIQNLINYIKDTNTIEEDREEKLQKIKEKLKNGFYENLNEEVFSKVADNLFDTSRDFLIQILRKK